MKRDLDWMDEASCLGLAPEDIDNLFFVNHGDKGNADLYPNRAYRNRICGGCPVRAKCESWGSTLIDIDPPTPWDGSHPQELVAPRDGVYGGVGPVERMKRRNKAA